MFEETIHDYPPVKRRGHYNNLAHLIDALTLVAAWKDVEPVMAEMMPYLEEIGSRRTERLLDRSTARIEWGRTTDTLGDVARELRRRLSAVR